MKSNQQIIVFEGPDGCGKTNIAQSLSQKINVPYFKNESEWEFFENDPSYFVNALTYGDPYFLSYLEQTGASVISDRWYPSEWVYSRVFDRPTNPGVLASVDNRAASLGAKIVIPFRTDYSSVVDQFESIITTKTLESIHDTYQEFAKWTNCPVYFLNVDDEDLEREISEITNFLRG